jgi:hypothetical protein
MMAAAVASRTPPSRPATAITRVATGGDEGHRGDGPAEAEAAAPAQPEQLRTLEDEVDRAARDVVRLMVVQRELGIAQLTDEDVKREQAKSVMVQTLKRCGAYRGQRVFVTDDGLMDAEVDGGESRIILPAFKEAHGSIWAGHLRGPPTFERLRRLYWWPRMREAMHNWVAARQDCGSRKARPKAVVPPLRSVRTGGLCDRWAIDVARPLPETIHGNRYVIAAVEYTT